MSESSFNELFDKTWNRLGQESLISELEDRLRCKVAVYRNHIPPNGLAYADTVLAMIWKYEQFAVSAIESLIESEELTGHLLGETLRWIGELGDGPAEEGRRQLLTKHLSHWDPVVRDGVTLGISAWDDPRFMPFVQLALSQETNPMVRQVLHQMVEQLEQTKEENHHE